MDNIAFKIEEIGNWLAVKRTKNVLRDSDNIGEAKKEISKDRGTVYKFLLDYIIEHKKNNFLRKKDDRTIINSTLM